MANDLMINADAFQTKPNAAFAHLDPETLSEGVGGGYGILGYKGKNWSLRHRGNTYLFTDKDSKGQSYPLPSIDVVILRQGKGKAKSYYEGYDGEGSAGKRPLCASIDGIRPDAGVQSPQSEACAICPRNVLKTDARGRKSRECTDYKRLAVAVLPSLTNALLGSPLLEAVFLRVPPASLNPLSSFGDGMNAMGHHFTSFITRVSFDPTVPYPKFAFKAVAPLNREESAVALELRDSAIAKRITGDEPGQGVARVATQAAPAGFIQETAPAGFLSGQLDGSRLRPEPELRVIEHQAEPAPTPSAAVAAVEDVGELAPANAMLDDKLADLMKTHG